MEKKKILVLHRAYPVSISKYFLTAFKHREDVEIFDASPFYGRKIPWNGGQVLPDKYNTVPDYVIPFDYPEIPWDVVDMLSGFQKWDMVLSIDAGIHWLSRPQVKCPVVHVATDPHVLNYDKPREYSDFFFNMQLVYSKGKDIYLPYAFSKYHFYPEPDTEKVYDASLIGLQYANRIAWVTALRNSGKTVYFNNGDAFDEYRHITNQSRVVLSWSSKEDLICRVFEALGMGVPLITNTVPDMHYVFGDDLPFWSFRSDLDGTGAAKTVEAVLENSDEFNKSVVRRGLEIVNSKHTFDHRVDQILNTVFGE